MTLLPRFRRHLASLRLGGSRALVAVSGGPDSVALLDLLVRSADIHGLDLVVAHVDHGIHPDSGEVAERVRSLAASYGLGFEGGALRLGPDTTETIARVERHAWLEAARRRVGADLVFMAHHADDQVETVLMRVVRGSGPAGLAGMAARRGAVVRPLLPFRKAELASYLSETERPAWLDPANADPRHLRSWLRAEVLPVLRARLPDIDAKLGRVARQASRDRAAWDALLDQLAELEVRGEEDGVSVAASPLNTYDLPLAEALVLAAARRAGCPLGRARLPRIVALIAAGDSGTEVPLGGRWRAELSFGRLHIVKRAEVLPPEPWSLAGDEGEGSWGRWQFRWRRDAAPARQERRAMTAWFEPHPPHSLVVRGWEAGDRVRPLDGAGTRPIARCLQEARVPRRHRGTWPVLVRDDQVLWVPGICRSHDRMPSRGTEALRVDADYA